MQHTVCTYADIQTRMAGDASFFCTVVLTEAEFIWMLV